MRSASRAGSLPPLYDLAIGGMTLCYLVLLEAVKRRFYRRAGAGKPLARAALSENS